MTTAIYPISNGEFLVDRTLPLSKCVGINLVNNPRNIISDAIQKSLNKIETSTALVEFQVARFTYKVEEHKKLIKNISVDGKFPTETPYPFGMMQSYSLHSNYDISLIKKDCEAYTRQGQTKATKRLTNLVDYLNTEFSKRNLTDFIDRKYVIDLMPDSTEKDTLMATLLEEVNTEEDAYLTIQQPLYSANYNKITKTKLKKELQLDKLSIIYSEQAESNKYGKDKEVLDVVWNQRILSAKNTIDLLDNELQDLYFIQEKILYSVSSIFDLKQKYVIPDLPSQPQVDIHGNTRIYLGLIPKLEDDLYLHSEWVKEPLQIRIVSIANTGQNYTPFVCKLYQQTFGTAGFWGCDMLPFKPNIIPALGEYNRNLKDPDRFKIRFFEDDISINNSSESLTDHFIEDFSLDSTDEEFVIFQITKNKYPLNYRNAQGDLFYNTSEDRDIDYTYDVIMSSKESPYLKTFKEPIKLSKEFHPALLINTRGESLNNNYNEELLRNLYVDVVSINKKLSSIFDTYYRTYSKDSEIQTLITSLHNRGNNLFETQRLRFSTTISNRTNYVNSNPNKLFKEGTITNLLGDNISDVYFIQGISLNSKQEASNRYLFKFFEYLESISNISKQDFITYQKQQTIDPDTNPKPYLMQNIFSVKNKLLELNYHYSYIEIEDLFGTWNASKNDYLNGKIRSHTKGFAMTKIVPKNKKKLFYHTYTQFNPNTLVGFMDFYGRFSTPWAFNVTPINHLSYEESILEVYFQYEDNQYKKISIHGLKQIIKRKPGYLEMPEADHLTAQDTYLTESFSYVTRKSFTDITENYLTKQIYSTSNKLEIFNINLDTQKEIEIIPTISNTLSSFIIPLWDHKIDDETYYNKEDCYNIITVDSVYQDSLQLLVFSELTKKQLNPIENDKYWIPINLRDYALTAYLDKFISLYSLDQEKIIYELDYTKDNNYPLDESYKDLMYYIGTAPNVSTYLTIPPNPFKSVYMTAMHRVSTTLSSNQMHNKTSFHFEKLSIYNKIFGDVKDNKFQIRKNNGY